jgi:hypothetical protein
VLVRKAELIRDRHEVERRAIDQAIDKAAITKEWIVTRPSTSPTARSAAPSLIYGEGGLVTSWQPTGRDDGNAINALRLLAQMGGHLVEKVEIGAPGDFARLTDEELTRDLILVGESIGIPGDQIQKAIAGGAK